MRIAVGVGSRSGGFGGRCTHAKCGGRLWLLSATLRPQEKREHQDGEREQSRKQIHILIGQSLCLLGYGRAHWPVVCECCLMDKTLCLHKIDQSGNGQGGDRRTRATQERIGSWQGRSLNACQGDGARCLKKKREAKSQYHQQWDQPKPARPLETRVPDTTTRPPRSQ